MTPVSSDHPRVSIIIVAYNSEKFIGDSLAALQGIKSDYEIIVIDNSSNHESLPVVKSFFPDSTTIPSDTNLGFAKAVNLASRSARGDFILLLNPDCIVNGEQIDSMLSEIEANKNIGVLAPVIEHPQGRLTVRSAGYEPTARHMFFQLAGLSRWRATAGACKGFNLYPAGESSDKSTSVDWVSGACFVTPRHLWQELGGLSEKWFMYAEDIEFCRRIRSLGYDVIHSNNSRAHHVVGASSEAGSGPVWTLWIENLAEYYVQEFRPNRMTWLIWRLSVWALYWSRAQVYRVKAAIFSSRKSNWLRECEKFRAYAQAAFSSTAL
ncbi:glycosyltransferase family 2 protein [Arthrobacter sp. 135MFCol5.1]|uniref:glycosyltransferase family 2 protein n=1 Tax=Arthrobacter sp. 135MFCol5.1 TaxID=1158050 RepID=UPI0009DB5C43|nr:glycosyltransferase family 2 protein [Arthrobacter sp. 135MFCol5.1]